MRAAGSLSSHPWPADKVERWPIEKLIPSARNARTHSEAQVDQIAASIREWGWTSPVLVDDDATVIAGHGRILAARKLRIPEVPVMVATGWSQAQKRAYAIADPRSMDLMFGVGVEPGRLIRELAGGDKTRARWRETPVELKHSSARIKE